MVIGASLVSVLDMQVTPECFLSKILKDFLFVRTGIEVLHSNPGSDKNAWPLCIYCIIEFAFIINVIKTMTTQHNCKIGWHIYALVAACLVYISRALLRDPGYMKGLAFMQKIYNEENRLKEQTKSLFKDWYVNNLIKNAVCYPGTY